MRRRRVARGGATFAATALLAVLAAVWLGPAAGARTAPTLSLSSTTVTPGQSVGLSGEHWPPHMILQASICGGSALQGHTECDLEGSITFGPANDGTVQTSMTVEIPPTPCPCVVLVTSTDPTMNFHMTVPIDIQSAPTAPPTPAPRPYQPVVTVIDPHVVSDSSWTSWFGAAATQELVVSVRNTSLGPLRPLLAARWIDGTTSHVIRTPRSKTIRVGQTVTLVAPFSLSTFAWGHKTLSGQVQGTTFDVNFSTGTSAYPWGLLVLAVLIIVAVVVLMVLAIVRRRRPRRPEPVEGGVVGEDETSREVTETGAVQ